MLLFLVTSIAAALIDFERSIECRYVGLITIQSKKMLSFVAPQGGEQLNRLNLTIDANGIEFIKNVWEPKTISYYVKQKGGKAKFILSNQKIPIISNVDYCAFQLHSHPHPVGQYAIAEDDLDEITSKGMTCSVARATLLNIIRRLL